MKATGRFMTASRQSGFTLLELMLALLIVGVLAQIALPAYQNEVDRARLATFLQRIDTMRTTMKSAFEQGDRSMFSFTPYPPGVIPPELAPLGLGDSLEYPHLSIFLIKAGSKYGVFDDNLVRPFLMVRASDVEGGVTLRNLAAVYPESRTGWIVPSTILVIPLLDEGVPKSATSAGSR